MEGIERLTLNQDGRKRGVSTHQNTQYCSEFRPFRRWKTVALIFAVAILVIVAIRVGNVYAQTLVLTPNPVTQGVNVMATGNGYQSSENGQIQVYVYTDGSCAAIPSLTVNGMTDDNGNLEAVTIPTSGLSPGTYCVEGNGFLNAPNTVTLTVNPGAGSTGSIASTAPEYMYTVPIAIVIIVAYVVLNRMKLV